MHVTKKNVLLRVNCGAFKEENKKTTPEMTDGRTDRQVKLCGPSQQVEVRNNAVIR